MTYEESIARQRQRLHDRIDLWQRIQAMGDVNVAEMVEILEQATTELQVLDELVEPIESDCA